MADRQAGARPQDHRRFPARERPGHSPNLCRVRGALSLDRRADPTNPTAPWNQTQLESLRTTLNIGVDSDLSILGREASLSWGLEFGRDKTTQKLIDGQDVATPLKNRSTAAYAQLTLPVNDAITLSGGVRYDRFKLSVGDFTRPRAYYYFPAYGIGLDLAPVSVTGGEFDFDEWTGNLGFTANIAPTTQVFGGWSQGYSPTDIGSFTCRAGMNSMAEICTAYGNDNPLIGAAYRCTTPGTYALSYVDIAPEPQVVDTYELGLRHDGGDWNGQVSAFYSTSDDGVNFDPITNRVSQQKERIWGVEAQGVWTLASGTVLNGMIGFREGRYDSDGDGKIEVWLGNNRIGAPVRVWLGVTRDFAGWIGRAEAMYLGGRDRAEGQLELPSVTLVNASLSRELGQGMLTLAVENLFDRDYVNPTATATRNAVTEGWGRTVAVSYRMSF
ncbi:TonB-dependent receptor (plasmid) [Paracoccus versutus]|nr:TonB-dependent receptor [Paracoccus versutus]